MRLRAIVKALYYGIAPWWLYEDESHYNCGYLRHLAMNIALAGRWLTFRETAKDREFEEAVNG